MRKTPQSPLIQCFYPALYLTHFLFSSSLIFYIKKKFFFIGVQLIYNVVLVSGVLFSSSFNSILTLSYFWVKDAGEEQGGCFYFQHVDRHTWGGRLRDLPRSQLTWFQAHALCLCFLLERNAAGQSRDCFPSGDKRTWCQADLVPGRMHFVFYLCSSPAAGHGLRMPHRHTECMSST